MLKPRLISSIAFILATLATTSQAAIYKYVDSDGNVTFTDKNRPGAIKLADTPNEPASVSTSRRRGKSSYNPSPASFPRVDAATQTKRDDVRRTLLEEERSKEQKNLATAKATQASSGKRPAAEQEKLAETVRLHEKNIEMLDKELARIK
jgi:hypothetical protein